MDFVYLGTCFYFIALIVSIESLTFTTENFHGGKWIIKHGATDILICRNNPYTGKMSLIYEKQRVAECSQNSCTTYFTDNGAFKITFDIKNGEIQWKINPITSKYDGKLFKCSDGTETLRLSPIVQESLTFTTENLRDGKWIIKNGTTDTLICRSNPYTGKMALIYAKQRVAECSQNSCKTYFTSYGAFKITFDNKNGEMQWKINPVTMKYDGMLFSCSDGTETLILSPIVKDSDTNTSWIVMHLSMFVLVLALFIFAILSRCSTVLALLIFAILSHCSGGQPTITQEKTEHLSDTDDNSLDRMKQLSDTDDNSIDEIKEHLSDTDDSSLDRVEQLSDTDDNGLDRTEQLSDTDNSTMVTPKARAKGKLSCKPISSIVTRENRIIKNILTFKKVIGKGQFAEVWKGVWQRSGKDKNVALKTYNTVKGEQVGVHIEVKLMQGMDHENIVQFYGTCIHDDKTTIVMELIENGSLLKYLHDERGNLETPAFVDIGSQIVKGLIYLESQKIIHRDLAARNILVSSFREGKTIKNVKIADFGLARRLTNANSEYIPMQGELTPFNGWTAPEALEDHIFTFKSDVWSFGILFMEMVMFGERPYAGMADEDILPYLKQSSENRMKCPKHCHPELYQIIQMCWKFDRAVRPTFKELEEKLHEF